MKNKLRLVTTFALMLMITTSFASTPHKEGAAKTETTETTHLKSIKKMISKTLIYPSFAKADNIEGDVWVKINVDPNGNLRVVESNSMYKLLESYTRIKIESLNAGERPDSAELYLRISYKIL